MTTVAYHNESKTIAVDSRETARDLISTDKANKFDKVNGEYYVSVGDVEDCNLLIDIIINNTQCNRDLNANVMFTKSGKVYNSNYYADDGLRTWEIKRNYTMGSGEAYALAAMDFECGAKDAVKYAMTRDIYTGGRVRVVVVK